MGAIHDSAAEYATVQRLSEMLEEAPGPYKVTEAYALFTTILCWVLQRVRVPEYLIDPNDHLARTVRRQLEESFIEDEPWSIVTNEPPEGHLNDIGPFPEFRGMSAFEFLKCLRDAVAHGDARTIQPFNLNGVLVGHSFHCEARPNEYLGHITLRRSDMRRIGCALAQIYCRQMQQEPGGAELAEDAAFINEDVAV